ncbi:MAG: hypothetical protein Q7S26_02760 [bacterium]|nr:hypothetical protein [bacterium]
MQKPRKIIFVLGLFALFAAGSSLFISAPLARAQLSAVPDPVQYLIAPEAPEPGQQVTIVAQGVGGFLGGANITWTQNGKVALSGIGETNFSFITGSLGSKTSVGVRIVSPSQGTITHDFIFLPSLVNLIWEADTTAPPLYRGKSLYSAGSNVKVVSFPAVIVNGARIATNSLSMQWSLNDVPMPNQSGLGRNIFSFAGDQLQPQETVAVDMYYGANKVGHGEITISAVQPLVLLYYKDPLRGVLYDSALPSAISLSAKELTIQAAPYFFANSSLKSGALVYSWTLNGEDACGPDSAKGILTLRQTGVGQGAAAVGVTLQNNDSDKFVQAASAALQLIFGQLSSGSLFGL